MQIRSSLVTCCQHLQQRCPSKTASLSTILYNLASTQPSTMTSNTEIATYSLLILALSSLIHTLLSRLLFHPLHSIPGPRLAALTYWYDCYFDLIKAGQYAFNIKQLHAHYDPFIRVTPDLVHINKIEYLDTIYARRGRIDPLNFSGLLMSFGKGHRLCLGMNLAHAELCLAIAAAAEWEMELSNTDESDVKFKHEYQISHPRLDTLGVKAAIKGEAA